MFVILSNCFLLNLVVGVIEWIMGIRSGKWMGFLTRETMQNAGSYQEAVAMLSKTEMLAPAYFIVGGNKSGEVCKYCSKSREVCKYC